MVRQNVSGRCAEVDHVAALCGNVSCKRLVYYWTGDFPNHRTVALYVRLRYPRELKPVPELPMTDTSTVSSFA